MSTKKGPVILNRKPPQLDWLGNWEKTKHNVGYPKRDKQKKKSKNFGP